MDCGRSVNLPSEAENRLFDKHTCIYLMVNSPRWVLSWREGGRRKRSEE